MTFTFTALLCLGLALGFWTPVLAGTLPKPLLRAQPDSVVSLYSQVTLLCEGTTGAKVYYLYKEGNSNPWRRQIPQNPGNKVEFSIRKIYQDQPGKYRCRYQTHDETSEDSDPLELVVTGAYWKPSLSAQPSPVVISGENVTILCVSGQQYHRLILTEEGRQKLSWTLDSQYNHYTGQFKALFSVGPVTSNQRWIFRCYSYDKNRPQVWSEPSDPLELLVSGNLHKATIKAEPSSVITSGSPMTIWCQGTPDAEIYVLHKEGSPMPLSRQIPKDPGKKAMLSIPYVTQYHAGEYRCYCYSSAGWSERSDSLELLVTGFYYNNKPSLSALPSPVVTSGGNMTLQCVSWQKYDKLILTKDNQKFSSSIDSQYIPDIHQYQALFSMDHVTPDHRGTFRCYGYYKETPQLWSVPSDVLEIHISGLSKKPSLLTLQGHILHPGKSLTLQCHSDIHYDRFALHKVGEADLTQHYAHHTQAGFSMANFTLGSVSQSTGGQYRCYGIHNISEWSASSDPLDIMITGMFDVTPSLSAQTNSTVHSGDNLTLLCSSMYKMDTFLLSKEGEAYPPLRLRSVFQDRKNQAEFFMRAVTSDLRGTYRCYGSHNSSPYLLSHASDPVQLKISEPSSPPPSSRSKTAGLEWYLIGVSVCFLLLLFILIFLLLRRKHQGKFKRDAQKKTELQLAGAVEPVTRERGAQKRSKPDAATQEDSLYASVEDVHPRDTVELGSLRPEEDPQGETYAQVERSKPKRAGAVLPSVMSREESLDTKDGHAEEGREMDSQAAESEEPSDVIYAQLCRTTLRQGTAAPPPSQAREVPEEPSVYASLAAARPGAATKDKE